MSGTVPFQNYVLTAIGRLAWLLAWTWLALLHAGALALALAALWWTQAQPPQVLASVSGFFGWTPTQALGATLVAVGGGLFGYFRLLRKIAEILDLRIRKYLPSGLG